MHVCRAAPVNLLDEHRAAFALHREVDITPPKIHYHGRGWFMTSSQALFSDGGRVFAPSVSYEGELAILGRKYYWLRRLLQRGHRINGRVVVITDKFANNYYHWHTETLPSLMAFLRSHQAASPCTFVIPYLCAKLPYVRESLALFITNPEQIIYAPDNHNYHGREFVYCAKSLPMGSQDPELMQALVAHYRQKLPAPATATEGRKIYLKRGGASARKRALVNEAEVEKLLSDFGFECLDFDALAYREQIAICQNSRVLVSIHGAGLSNMIFMPKGAQIFEFKSKADLDNESQCFYALADCCGHEYFYLACESTLDTQTPGAGEDHIGNLHVDIPALKANIEHYRLH